MTFAPHGSELIQDVGPGAPAGMGFLRQTKGRNRALWPLVP